MKIKLLKKEDLPLVAELEALCFFSPWSERSLSLLCGESGFGLGLFKGTQLLGYAGMLVSLYEGQVTNVATHPDARARGIGTAVFGALLEEARRRGVCNVCLEVRESNEPAKALYRKFGFTQVGKRPRFYTHPTEAALVMTCRIAGDLSEKS